MNRNIIGTKERIEDRLKEKYKIKEHYGKKIIRRIIRASVGGYKYIQKILIKNKTK